MGYKLLTQGMKTRVGEENETDWSDVGVWHTAIGPGDKLCTAGVLHDYDDPWIAVMMNPIHADIPNPVCYETERGGGFVTDGLKCGSKRMRLTHHVDLPDVSLHQKIAFGIYAALEVCHAPRFLEWANKWLSGEDRSRNAAYAAAYAAAAANAAAYAADAAATAADTAADTAAVINWQAIKTRAMQII